MGVQIRNKQSIMIRTLQPHLLKTVVQRTDLKYLSTSCVHRCQNTSNEKLSVKEPFQQYAEKAENLNHFTGRRIEDYTLPHPIWSKQETEEVQLRPVVRVQGAEAAGHAGREGGADSVHLPGDGGWSARLRCGDDSSPGVAEEDGARPRLDPHSDRGGGEREDAPDDLPPAEETWPGVQVLCDRDSVRVHRWLLARLPHIPSLLSQVCWILGGASSGDLL